MLDLSKKCQLTNDERLLLATAAQVALLEELVLAGRFRVGEAAFHGGTAIKAAWGGLRYSEDLDFMVSPPVREQLVALAERISGKVRTRFGVLTPGCVIEFGIKQGRETAEDTIDGWTIKWGHRNRIGKVTIKVDFFIASVDRLHDYEVKVSTLQMGNQKLIGALPVGNLLSLWADKLKAMATRADIKWRDVHDIAYLADRLAQEPQPPSKEERVHALGVTVAIYVKTLRDVRDGLSKRLDSGVLDRIEAFETDMGRWFSQQHHQANLASDSYKHMLRHTLEEMRTTVTLLDAVLAEEPRQP